MSTNPKVDAYFDAADRWREEMLKLRAIVLDSPLTEELKWRQPCYTLDGKNVVIISSFTDHCILGFFKGSLVEDPAGILVRPGTNTNAGRQMRFTSSEQIDAMSSTVAAYVDAAIAVERAGLRADPDHRPEIALPPELIAVFAEQPAAEAAWEALTPGRQRGYLLQFTGAKQSETRRRRIEKHLPRILEGKGLHDR